MQRSFQRRLSLALLLGAALAVRLAAGVGWQAHLGDPTQFGFADSQSYWSLAQEIANGRAYQFRSDEKRIFRTPGYPLLLAAMFCLVGDNPPVVWARAQNALFGVLAVGGVVCLCRQLFDEPTAMLAGMLAAVYPGAIAMSTFVLSEGAFCPLMLAQLICWTAASKTEFSTAAGRRRLVLLAVAGGLAAGAATLVRPSWLLFTPFVFVLALLFSRQRAKQASIGLGMLAGLIVAMMPWWVRNYQIAGRFVPTTLQVGASLYDGLNPHTTGGSDMSFVPQFHADQRAADHATPSPARLFEDRLDQRMRNASIAWARGHPLRVVQLMGIKLVRLWNVWPNAAELQSWPLRMLILVGYLPLLVCGLWGAWRFTSKGWPYALCLFPAVYFTALHVVFVSSIRYRQPAMLSLIVLAAGAIGPMVLRRRRSEEPPATPRQ